MHSVTETINLDSIAKTLVTFLKSPPASTPDQSIAFIFNHMKKEYDNYAGYGNTTAAYHWFVGNTKIAEKIRLFNDDMRVIVKRCPNGCEKSILEVCAIETLDRLLAFFKQLTPQNAASIGLIHAVLNAMQIKISKDHLQVLLVANNGKNFIDEFDLAITHVKQATVKNKQIAANVETVRPAEVRLSTASVNDDEVAKSRAASFNEFIGVGTLWGVATGAVEAFNNFFGEDSDAEEELERLEAQEQKERRCDYTHTGLVP